MDLLYCLVNFKLCLVNLNCELELTSFIVGWMNIYFTSEVLYDLLWDVQTKADSFFIQVFAVIDVTETFE